jgi:hypothetical protein
MIKGYKPKAKQQQKKNRNPVRKARAQAAKPSPKVGKVGSSMQIGNAVAAAYSRGFTQSEPKISALRDRSRIKHKELLGNVTGSTSFAISNQFSLNPGLSASFPWLSTQAIGWENYRFHALRFCYLPRTGTNVPGSVILAPDYDASDSAPTSEMYMTTYAEMREDAVWKEILVTLRPAAMFSVGPTKFVRNNASNIGTSDIRLYDAGNLFVGTVDGTAVNWGKIYVEYDVEFFTPQTPPSGINFASYWYDTQTGAVTATPFGTTASVQTGSLPFSVLTNTGGVGVITTTQAGTYDITWTVDTSGTSTPSNPTTSGVFSNFETVGYEITGSGSTKSAVHIFGVVLPAGGTVTFGSTITVSGQSRMSVILMPTGATAS